MALVALPALLLACAPGGPTPAAPPAAGQSAAPAFSPQLQALIDGARREGQLTLVWSGTAGGGPEGVQRMAEGFNRAYGLQVDVRFTPGPFMPEMANKIVQEYQAGRPASSDIFLGSETNTLSMMQADALELVDWASWAPNVRDPELLAPGGAAVEIATRASGITYNTNRVKPEDVPTSMQDLLLPRFKGTVATTPYAANFHRLAVPELWGEQRVLDYVGKLADQVAGLISCGELERVASGEFDVFAIDCGDFVARQWQAKGAPIGHVIPSDAPLLGYWYLAVPKNAAHPNAAKLWINYVLGREAQDVLYQTEVTDHHLVPGSKVAGSIQAVQARGVKLIEADIQWILDHDEDQLNHVRVAAQQALRKQ